MSAGENVDITTGKAETVSIYNLTGALEAAYTDTDVVPTSGLNAGVYLVNYIVDGVSNTERLIIR